MEYINEYILLHDCSIHILHYSLHGLKHGTLHETFKLYVFTHYLYQLHEKLPFLSDKLHEMLHE